MRSCPFDGFVSPGPAADFTVATIRRCYAMSSPPSDGVTSRLRVFALARWTSRQKQISWRRRSPSLRSVLRRSLFPRSTRLTPLTFNERRRPQQRSPALRLRVVIAVRPHGSFCVAPCHPPEITTSKSMSRSCHIAADAVARRTDPLRLSVEFCLASTARSAGPR